MTGFLKMEGEDFVAFLTAGGIGYVVGALIGDPELSAIVSIIFSYHLFLTWLVMKRSGKTQLSMSVPATVLTHTACMTVALGPTVFGAHKAPFFSVFRYGIAGLALFEQGWLFSKEQAKGSAEDILAAQPALSVRPTPEDEIAWLEYLSKRRPGMTKPGTTVRQEHDAWLRARHAQRLREQALMEAQEQQQEGLTGENAVPAS